MGHAEILLARSKCGRVLERNKDYISFGGDLTPDLWSREEGVPRGKFLGEKTFFGLAWSSEEAHGVVSKYAQKAVTAA